MRRARLTFVAATATACCAAAGGLASAHDEGEQVQSNYDQARPETAVIDSASARDPRGGPPWRLRIHRTAAGRTCFTAGRVVAGRFGEMDRGGAFTEAPLDGVATCADFTPPVDYSVLSGSSGDGEADALTVVAGVVSADVSKVEVSALGQTVSQTPSDNGGFVAALAGVVDQSSLPLVTATLPNGTKRSYTIDQ